MNKSKAVALASTLIRANMNLLLVSGRAVSSIDFRELHEDFIEGHTGLVTLRFRQKGNEDRYEIIEFGLYVDTDELKVDYLISPKTPSVPKLYSEELENPFSKELATLLLTGEFHREPFNDIEINKFLVASKVDINESSKIVILSKNLVCIKTDNKYYTYSGGNILIYRS